MRKTEKIPQPGDTRTRRVFLFFPLVEVKISDTKETRWLEWAEIEEIYSPCYDGSPWEFNKFINP